MSEYAVGLYESGYALMKGEERVAWMLTAGGGDIVARLLNARDAQLVALSLENARLREVLRQARDTLHCGLYADTIKQTIGAIDALLARPPSQEEKP